MQPGSELTTRQVAEAILVQPEERGKLLAYARSRFGICAGEAEDLIQETALELLRQRGYVRRPEAFVFVVFRARCTRFISGLSDKRAVFANTIGAMENAAAPMGAAQFDRQVALRQALGLISSPCRRLLSAYYVEGVDLREAASRLSLSYSSASTTLSRCLKKLRECMA